jgi:hypothetical protein
MSLALARKEAQEHAAVAVLALLASGLLILTQLILGRDGGGRFEQLVVFVGLAVPVNAMLAANRLLVREYAGRTQLFLEVLPIGRARVFATKWLIGLAWTGAITAGAWLLTLEWQRAGEVIAWSDARPVLGALLAFSAAMWAFAALCGTLGRYRYVAWIAAVALVAIATEAGGRDLDELPVMRLLGSSVQMARIADPWPMALEAVQIAALCTAVAAVLALLGSGAIASALSLRMTVRERVFILVSALGALVLYLNIDDDRVRPPFELTEGAIVEGTRARASVMPTPDFKLPRAKDLARDIARDADTLIAALGLSARATVFVLPQRGIDRFVIERARIGSHDGIVLRASHEISLDRLRSFVLHSLLADHTHRRAMREDRHVLLDGLALWWVLRGDASGRERWWLRAAASRVPITAASIQRWEETSEQLGNEMATGVAFAVVDVLAARIGEERMLELLAALFAEPHHDVRVLLETAPRTRLERAGAPWDELARGAESARQEVAAARARELAARPTLRARVEVEQSDEAGTRVVASLEGAPLYRVLHAPLTAWNAGQETLSRVDARTPRVVLPITPRRGSRLLAAIELDDPVLDCPVRVLAERLVVP